MLNLSTLSTFRDKAWGVDMAEKEATERRVYVLPSELVERIRSFQEATGIPSEVEAVRRLLDAALQRRDTIESIMEKIRERLKSEKDLRIISRDILVTHPLVKSIRLTEDGLYFDLETGQGGQITNNLKTFVSYDLSNYENFPPSPSRDFSRPTPFGSRSKAADFDDDIPF